MSALAVALDDIPEVTPESIEAATNAARILAPMSSAGSVRLKLEESDTETISLPADIFSIVLDLLTKIANGDAVSVVPVHAELTTQQAAHYLNVSRPHVIKLIEGKQLPHRMVGTHRKVLAKDVLNYRSKIDAERASSLNALADHDREIGIDDDHPVGSG